MPYPGAFRRDFYVTPTGSNAAVGSPAHPLLTIGEAARRLEASDGGTVHVGSTQAAPLTGSVLANTVPLTILPWDASDYYVTAAAAAQDALTLTGPGQVTLDHGHFDGTPGTLGGVSFGTTIAVSGLAHLVATDCTAHGTQTGWNGIGRWVSFAATRCDGLGGTNDGFGLHGIPADPTVTGTATLTNCTADGCGDEAVSPHEYAVLNIVGGLFRNSAQSGMAAVGSAVCNISGGAIFELNGREAETSYGGLYYSGGASGVLDGVTLRNNDGPGVWLNTTGTVTLTDYTSTGNGAADIL